MTTAELDLLRAADVAMDRYDKAQTSRNPAELAKARTDIERLRGELEKLRHDVTARELVKSALTRPFDLSAPMAKARPHRVATTGRSDHQFNKLVTPAGRDALAK